LSLAFSWIRLNLGFFLREKLAAVLIIPSSWGSQLDGDLHQHTVPHQSHEAVDWILGLPHFLGPHARQSTLIQALGIPPNRAFPRGQPLGAQCEASPTRLGKERETPRHFVARAITSPHRPTTQPLLSLSPLTLPLTLLPQIAGRFLFHRQQLHRRRRPCCHATSLLLPCRFLASSGSKHLAGFQPPPAKFW
jgi:hypothetical protein